MIWWKVKLAWHAWLWITNLLKLCFDESATKAIIYLNITYMYSNPSNLRPFRTIVPNYLLLGTQETCAWWKSANLSIDCTTISAFLATTPQPVLKPMKIFTVLSIISPIYFGQHSWLFLRIENLINVPQGLQRTSQIIYYKIVNHVMIFWLIYIKVYLMKATSTSWTAALFTWIHFPLWMQYRWWNRGS